MEYSFCFPGEPKPSSLRLWQAPEAESSTHEYSDEDQSQLLLILMAYDALREQGFYEPHVHITHKGMIERVAEEDGTYSTLI